jgi:hypothetical protein
MLLLFKLLRFFKRYGCLRIRLFPITPSLFSFTQLQTTQTLEVSKMLKNERIDAKGRFFKIIIIIIIKI